MDKMNLFALPAALQMQQTGMSLVGFVLTLAVTYMVHICDYGRYVSNG